MLTSIVLIACGALLLVLVLSLLRVAAAADRAEWATTLEISKYPVSPSGAPVCFYCSEIIEQWHCYELHDGWLIHQDCHAELEAIK